MAPPAANREMTTDPNPLEELARHLQVSPSYQGADGKHCIVPEASLRAIVGALGFAAQSDSEAIASVTALTRGHHRSTSPPVVVVREDEMPYRIALSVPVTDSGRTVRWRLTLESGAVTEGSSPIAAPPVDDIRAGGEAPGPVLELTERLPLGYHRLELTLAHSDGERTEGITLITVPHRGYRPDVIEGEGRCWGIAVQLYGVRSRRNWGIGDLTDLVELMRGVARVGGAVVGINPLHALFPAWPLHASPYSPSSRLFRNPLYIDIEAVPEFDDSEPLRRMVASEGFQAELRRLRERDTVDYAGVAATKHQAFEFLYRAFRDRHLADPDSLRGKAFRTFQAERNPSLRRFAIFSTLTEVMAADGLHSMDAWPAPYRDPTSPALARFEEANLERIEFHEYLQWLAEEQITRASDVGRRLGLGVGLYQDLAVGADSGGAEAWENHGLFARKVGVGAPPDAWNLKGQNWGFPPWNPIALRAAAYRPYIDLLRANMRCAGALRIDHVMGLMRLYWIPAGMSPRDGSYVGYPWRDLIGILALESVRHRCLVIGEDLGTVPEGLREQLLDAGVLSIRLLYFERDEAGRVRRPADYPREAVVAIGTHDLPTLPAFWTEADLALRDTLGLWPSPERRAADLAERPQHRAALLDAFRAEGVPTEADPAAVPVRAAHAFLGRTPSRILILHLDDILEETRQVNVPGTVGEHPNWCRRLQVPLEELWDDARLRDAVASLPERSFAALHPNERPHAPRPAPAPPAMPRATYRIQLGPEVTFDDVAGLAPYLDALGVTHLYGSSWLKARSGSTHGYDITDHNAINPEIGDVRSLDHLSRVLADRSMGHILDFVPNHMGIGKADNAWWLDVLEWGQESPFADYFDIDWTPLKSRLHHKVLVPFLGDHYGTVLEAGELVPRFDAASGSFSVWYHEHRLPITPTHYPALMRAAVEEEGEAADASWRHALGALAKGFEALGHRRMRKGARRARARALQAELAVLAQTEPAAAGALARGAAALCGRPGEPRSFLPLHRLLERQPYRLAYWRVASDEINYRRFFDINELAGIRTENPEVFEAVHRFVAALIARGTLQGLRIDHIDGLFHPREYCIRLQALAAATSPAAPPVYVVVEKILARHEALRREWPVAGTTGYDFLNQVNGLLTHSGGEAALTRCYRRFIGREIDFDELLYDCKKLVMETMLGSELNVLASEFNRISDRHWRTRDYTLESLRKALIEIVACFPVYRTYVARRGALNEDRRDIVWATRQAHKRWRGFGAEILDFVQSVLTTDLVRPQAGGYRRAEVIRAAMRFQQYTGPVMAKAMEDTAFYRYNRLVSLNEVGGDPRQFGLSAAAFHGRNGERARRWPHTLLATATHDTKRGEDARARLDVLSEIPGEWERAVRRWAALNRRKKIELDERPAPSRNDEYLIYQTLVGAWPPGLGIDDAGHEALGALTARIQAYMVKAAREAKLATSWASPDSPYEAALAQFVGRILEPAAGRAFLLDFLPFQRRVAVLGMLNGLVQLALKLTCPGVPDIYQGTELWDLNLVDPDNRRIPDFALRRGMLAALSALDHLDATERTARIVALVRDWHDGRIKLHVLRALLALRRRVEPVFTAGSYRPLASGGRMADRVVGFLREHGRDFVVVATGRHLAPLAPASGGALAAELWDDTSLQMPHRCGFALEDALTGRILTIRHGIVAARDLFAALPVAVLVRPHE